MPDIDFSKLADLLGPFLDAWGRRNETKAVKDAGSLYFWRDGMLEHLRVIAGGQATEKIFTALKSDLKETDEPMRLAMEKLRIARDKIGSGKTAQQIDIILHHGEFGKGSIRERIRWIVTRHKTTDMTAAAQHTCDAIETLNAEIDRLRRIVYPS
jgi:hypothetical protein